MLRGARCAVLAAGDVGDAGVALSREGTTFSSDGILKVGDGEQRDHWC